MKKKTPTATKKNHSIRIIGGKWRRRTLPVIDLDGLRPTGDRVRETLFNWLMPHITGARALDAFAGTGALGLEALSRGADYVQFIEHDAKAAKQLAANLTAVEAGRDAYQLTRGDALNWLGQYQGPAFDLIFLDPPFEQAYWDDCCAQLSRAGCLSDDALIYVETPTETKLNVPPLWQSHRQLKAGQVMAHLFKLQNP